MKSKVEVDTSEVLAAFQRLEASHPEMRRSFRSATRKSLAIYRKSVRQGAATVTHNREKQSKGVTTRVYKSVLGGSVGINKSFTLSTGKWFGLYLLELGTKNTIGRNGRLHGATPPKPFFQRSAAMAQNRAIGTLNDSIVEAIEKQAAKRK